MENMNVNKKNNNNKTNKLQPDYIVAIGASAGGLEALITFFSHMPSNSNMAFIVIQHLSPDHKSMMDSLLARHTDMEIFLAEDGMTVKPDCIYLIPPKFFLTIFHGQFLLNPFEKERVFNLPIDVFFISLAEDVPYRSIGIILSGTGSDGSVGIQAIKKAGGMVIVQDTESAQFDGMPRNAIATGMADYQASPDNMPDIIMNYANHPCIFQNGNNNFILNPEDTDLNKILSLLRKQTEVDFTHYKQNTIIRRIERRIGIVQADSLREYLNYLYDHEKEINLLYRDLLIGVTRFFRDCEEFEFLNQNIIPSIFENNNKEKNIRIWVAGTSTGEEAYTIVMLFNKYKEDKKLSHKITVFATDIDQNALNKASDGIYPEGIANDLKPELLEKYFIKIDNGYKIRTFIREQIIFAKQNIFKDPPFTKLDLITCRNLLIYLQNNLQQNVMDIFNFALKDKGYLFLGTSETVGTLSNHFIPLDNRIKIFRHEGQGMPPIKNTLKKQALMKFVKPLSHINNYQFSIKQKEEIENYYQVIINELTQLCLIVDESGIMIEVFGKPEKFLKFSTGKVKMDIKKMLPSKIAMIISTGLRQVIKEEKRIIYREIINENENNENSLINIIISPLFKHSSNNKNILIIFEESLKTVQDDENIKLQFSSERQLIDLEKEIQYTRENLQATIEELHASNEELQSTNEELISSNEELQSTNEELNSVNEELNTVNAEYQEKVAELYELNNDLNNLIRSIDIGTIFLDKNLCIRRFSPAITREINLLSQDIGRPLSDISSTIINYFYNEAQKVINTGQPIEKSIKANSGKWYLINILPYLDDRQQIDGAVMTMVDITNEKKIQLETEIQNDRLKKLIDINPKATIIFNKDGIIKYINKAAEKELRIYSKDSVNKKLDDIGLIISDIKDQTFSNEDNLIDMFFKTQKPIEKLLIKVIRPDQTQIVFNIFGNPFINSDNEIEGYVLIFETIAHQDKCKG